MQRGEKMTFSTVTKNEIRQIIAARKEGEKNLPDIKVKSIFGDTCKYAEDTGERAFVAAPCRGNKIICRKIDGHISYTKACCAEQCKFFEKCVDNKELI